MSIEKFAGALNPEAAARVARDMQGLCIRLAKKHLPSGDPLRAQIINYYSDFERLQQELANVFAGCDQEEIDRRMEERGAELNNRETFIAHYSKCFNISGPAERTQEKGGGVG